MNAFAAGARPSWRWFVNTDSYWLFFVAFIFGLVGAFYWTYAADLALDSGLPPVTSSILWSLVGLSGVVGVGTGDCVERFGFRKTLVVALSFLSAAIAVLGAAPGFWTAVSISAVLYGPGFMMISALLAIWSSRVFADRPSIGFSATLIVLAAGSMTGPAALGLFAAAFGLRSVFLLTATLTLFGLFGALPQRPGPKGRARTAGSPAGRGSCH